MNHEEILTPLELFRSRLRDTHARRSLEAFDDLLLRSGVDESANRLLAKTIRKLEKELDRLNTRLACWQLFRAVMWLAALAGSVLTVLWVFQLCGRQVFHMTTPAGLLSLGVATGAFALIFGLLNRKVRHFDELVTGRQSELKARMEEAWNMMEPLNRLYRWDTMAELVMKTLPILAIDRYLSVARLRQLLEYFKWREVGGENVSVLACQSGAVNGNPWVVVEELCQEWGTKIYIGTKVISWQARSYYTDSKGRMHSRLVTRSQTLVATLEKPIPVYRQSKRLIYGNEAAPELNFSREPNALSRADKGFWGRFKLRRAIAALERRSRDLDDSFTIMDNREFDACFNAADRDNEQQFRLLFTPLAQQEMLKLLRDGKLGYGDDFHFRKRGMINTLQSEHLDKLDITASPQLFRHYDLGAARRNFLAWSNEFFRALFFSFAPFFCIPLYQQHRNFQEIYKGIIEGGEAAFPEHESLINTLGEERFRPSGAITRSILKTQTAAGAGGDAVLTITAHAFRGRERVEYVTQFGGDGKLHRIPVHWIEYLPVSRKSQLAVCPAGTGDHLEFAEKLDTPEWQKRLRSLNSDGRALLFRRGLAAFHLNR